MSLPGAEFEPAAVPVHPAVGGGADQQDGETDRKGRPQESARERGRGEVGRDRGDRGRYREAHHRVRRQHHGFEKGAVSE
jgi:hypothetical protein